MELPSLRVDFDVDEFHKALALRICESTIGNKLKVLIDERLRNLTADYDRALRDAVDQQIKDVIRQRILKVLDENKAVFDEIIAKRVKDEHIAAILDRGLDKLKIEGRWG